MSKSKTDQPTLKLCGANNYNQLGEESNNKQGKENFISPLINSKLDVSNITSFSTYRDHTVLITKNGEIFGAGYNNDFRIIGSLPKKTIKTFTKFEIRDDEGQLYYPISAVCGKCYTLYMVAITKNSKERKLAISYKNIKKKNPLFLNTENFNPFRIFGGDLRSVSIDEQGQILYIPNSIQSHPSNRLITSKLPEGEKAIDVAFFTSNVVILSSSGHVFISEVEIGDGDGEEKEETDQLLPIRSDSFGSSKIVEISGNSNHCIILSEEGKLWGIGENFSGSLGIEKKSNSQYLDFVEITTLNNYVIDHVYSGFTHSLFQTKEGKILSCGKNDFGQLCCKTGQIKNFSPIETDIKNGAVFCVAGYKSSAIFINHDPLMNPNRIIKERYIEFPEIIEEEEEEKDDDDDEKEKLIERLKRENMRLIQEISELKKENSKLIKENSDLKKEKKEQNDEV